MKSLVEYSLAGGGEILVEVDLPETEGVVRAARGGELVARAGQTLEDAMDAVRPAILAVVSKLQALSTPDQINVEFGIKLGAKAGAFLTSADAEANFKIILSWKRG